MRLKTIVSPSVSRALEQVNLELGPHALILETEQEGELTRVVAADVEREEPVEGLMRLRAEIALLRRELSLQNEAIRALVARTRPAMVEETAIAAAAPAPAEASAPAPVVSRAVVATRADGAPGAERKRLVLLERRLREQGLRNDLLKRVLDLCAAAPPTEGDPLQPQKSEYCVTALAGLIPGIGPAGNHKARCFVFVGPGGSGKTTSLAKLLQQAKSPDTAGLAVISIEDRSQSTQLLDRTAKRLRIPHLLARGAEDVVRGIRDLGDPRTILVDTTGLGVREKRLIDALRERLPQAGQVAVHLVLRGDQDDHTALAQAQPYAELSPASLLLTRLDAAPRLGCIVNLPAALGLPVAAIGHGVALAGDLTVPTRRYLAELVLGRRLLNRR